ncbi:MarR family transcriptional regulator [Aromatoleum toluclasticum]|uniref:MarR family winged helix-turn-helix transcriptional regulator n=1 Tax=Aromatoleum toluclasticum TaxID=92003 RepID=UPI00036781AB|nr:MarR family transcriptional regulator [Aromatoleum toluclasticum]MCC4114962.1 MarR family transcriptional regulator [Aromatoleum toluclasticum]
MTAPSKLDDLYCRPGFLFKRCHQVAAAIFIEECREFNVTSSQFSALYVLHTHPGVDQIALGRLTGLDRSTVGLVIRLLEERKLLERWPNPHDKRRMQLKLSAAGERLLEEVTPAAERARQRVLAILPPSQRDELMQLLVNLLERHGAVIDAEAILEGKHRPGRFDFSEAKPARPARRRGA